MATVNGVSRGPSVSGTRSHGDTNRDSATAAAARKNQPPSLVSQLPYTTLSKLSVLLDTSKDGTQTMWRRLIEVMPHLKYNVTTVEKFALNANQPSGSPAYALLTDMANRGITYDELIAGLKKLNFYNALTEIGHREAVAFVSHPDAVPASVGQTVVLECEASGVPKPAYLWFKGREPLPEHTTCQLHIEKVSLADAGQYCCRASNAVNIEFSNWAEIKVSQPKVLRPGTPSPQIISGPSGEYHLVVNDCLRLVVVASAPPTQELSYQWFRDGQAMPYATGNELCIAHVQLGDQGVYTCRVSTKLGGSRLTDSGVVHVVVPQDNQMGANPMGVVNVTQPHPHQPVPQHTAVHPPPANYHTGHPMGGVIPPGMMYAPGPHAGMDTPSTQLTELRSTPGSQYTDMISPQVGNHFGPPEGMRPHDLPIHPPPQGGGGEYHHGNTGDTSYMYYNQDAPAGEQVDIRQPLFTGGGREGGQQAYVNTCGDDLMCGQGELRPDLEDQCYDKVALLIGNKNYRQSTLKLNTPENDAQDLAGVLRSAGFKVVSLVNLNKTEMEKALQYFASLLGKNVYALFFFAGHGFEQNSRNYMMAVDADVEKRTDQCICAQNVLHTMQARGAKLSIVLLDMCRVNASTPFPTQGSIEVFPQPKGTNGYFVIGFSCSPAERAFEEGTSPEGSADKKYKGNSIFVGALREHLQQGTLTKRIDNLLTDSASGVRKKGQQLHQYDQWQKPEVRSNLGENLSLNDPIKSSREMDTERQQRTTLWQKAHTVPDSVVVSCHSDAARGVKSGEVAFRLHFEAEHSNVLIVTAELLTGCLSPVEVININRMCLVTDYSSNGPSLTLEAANDKQYKFSEKSKYSYGHQQNCRMNDLVHFKIPDIQKIKSHQVILEMEVSFTSLVPGNRGEKTCVIRHSMNPPLYAQVLSQQLRNDPIQQQQQFDYIQGQFGSHGNTAMQPPPMN